MTCGCTITELVGVLSGVRVLGDGGRACNAEVWTLNADVWTLNADVGSVVICLQHRGLAAERRGLAASSQSRAGNAITRLRHLTSVGKLEALRCVPEQRSLGRNGYGHTKTAIAFSNNHSNSSSR